MNNTAPECYISHDDIELAQTIATYFGVGVLSLLSCLIVRCFCCKKPCTCCS